ncbi:MAG: hypothetical protein A2Z97_15035 [Bdellovibrionales bacterium GWB1_52_6]|nr:MAG: hypothetical protein A2Z97_15035 [Bdellovibrionales bacterium GWB1_52_6]OFZ03416.1 MAG: hypothetical protein A2X97_05575 [Bdellovibrionales bacterium GWA1_52_35]HCM40998.1 hypothetical protein [Bdellovibrionales bacterium]
MKIHAQLKKVQSLTNQALIADKCYEAEHFFDRLRGLIGKSSLENGAGMLFPECNNIHTWFMTMRIDVVFIRKEVTAQGKTSWKISSVHPGVRPWRILPLFDRQADDTLELPDGTIERCTLRAGDELCIS